MKCPNPDRYGRDCGLITCASCSVRYRSLREERDDWPVHQPECFDAPIPGRQWYGGCEPGGDWDSELGRYTGTGPRVNPATGICEGCGEAACPTCGRQNCPDHPTGSTYRPINIELRLTTDEARLLRKTQSAGSVLDDVLADALVATEVSKWPPPFRALVVGLDRSGESGVQGWLNLSRDDPEPS